MLLHVALGKNWSGISAGQSLEQKCDTEEWVIGTHFLVCVKRSVCSEQARVRRGTVEKLFGLAGESTWHCSFVQSLLRDMELKSHSVNLTKLLVPFLSVNVVGKGEKVHLCCWVGCIYVFSPSVSILCKEFPFWAFQPLSWYKSYSCSLS